MLRLIIRSALRQCLGVVILVSCAIVPLRADIYAVIVGVSQYDGSVNNLRSAAGDADKIYRFLEARKGGGQLMLLRNHEASRSDVIRAMTKTFSRAQANDLVIFYFSGHGMPGAFCPYDVQGGTNSLAHADIKQAFKSSRAGMKLCIADACYAGSIHTQPSGRNEGHSYSGSNVVVIMSSRSSETSLEINTAAGTGDGLFTKHLLDGMRGYADRNKDRRVSVEELYRYVRQHVRRESQQAQTPILYGNVSKSKVVITY